MRVSGLKSLAHPTFFTSGPRAGLHGPPSFAIPTFIQITFSFFLLGGLIKNPLLGKRVPSDLFKLFILAQRRYYFTFSTEIEL